MAVMDHDTNLAAELLDTGANAHARDERGNPAIFLAAYGPYGSALTRRLALFGADINAVGLLRDATPLCVAAEYADVKTLTTLIALHANPDQPDSTGATPLMLSALSADGYEKAAELIAAKADVNATNRAGETALDFAEWRTANDHTVSFIVSKGGRHGRDLTTRASTRPASPESSPRRSPHIARPQISIENDERSLDKQLLVALRSHDYKKAQELVSAGANCNSKDAATGDTALLLAATSPNGYETTRRLVFLGAKVDSPNSSGITPLIGACDCGSPDTIVFLVIEGADVRHRDRYARTPLIAAASANDSPTVRIRALVQTAVDYNGADHLGFDAIAQIEDRLEKRSVMRGLSFLSIPYDIGYDRNPSLSNLGIKAPADTQGDQAQPRQVRPPPR